MSLPLAGCRVLVTRAAHQAGKLSEGLRAVGAEPVEVPVLEIQPPASYDALDAALHQWSEFDWILFTSANTVRAVVERAASLDVVLGETTRTKIAAIGQATAAVLKQAGFSVSLVPESYVAESLLSALAGQVSGKHILIARAAVARDVIPNALREAGALVEIADAYQNGVPVEAPEQLSRALRVGIDAVTFTSSSSVTHLAAVAAQAQIAFPFAGVRAISIGPITSQTLRDHGWQPVAEANPSDIPGLIEAVIRAL